MKKTGKIIFALTMFVFGMMHFINASEMSGMLQNWPAAQFFVYLSGAGLVLAALSIIINKYTRIASILLSIELFAIIIVMHVPHLGEEGAAQISMIMILKDLGLLACALIIAGISGNQK